jgi:hypothetical protein
MGRSVDIDLRVTTTDPNAFLEPSVQERLEYRRSVLSVLDRSQVIGRYNVTDLPSHIHAEWVSSNPEDVQRLLSLGFTFADDLAKKSPYTTTDGAGNPTLLDCRLMSIPKWKYEDITSMREELIKKDHNAARGSVDLYAGFPAEAREGLSVDPTQVPSKEEVKLSAPPV